MANSMNGDETPSDQPTSTTCEASPADVPPENASAAEAPAAEANADECDGEAKQNGEATTTQPENETENTADQPPAAKRPRLLGPLSNARIETVKENLKEQSLTIQQINEYCKSLFHFKNIRVMRFRWANTQHLLTLWVPLGSSDLASCAESS